MTQAENAVAAIQFGKTTYGMENEAIQQMTGIGQLCVDYLLLLKLIQADNIDEWEDLKL